METLYTLIFIVTYNAECNVENCLLTCPNIDNGDDIYNTPIRHSRIGHEQKRIVSVVVRQMFVLYSLNVLFMSYCHPPKTGSD